MKFYKTSIAVACAIALSAVTQMILPVHAQTSGEPTSVVLAVAPTFPPVAAATNTCGSVVIETRINAAGEVTSAKIIEGDSLLRRIKAFEETARRWRFTKGLDGRILLITFDLSIMPRNTPPGELTPIFTLPYKVEIRHLPFDSIVDSHPSTSVRLVLGGANGKELDSEIAVDQPSLGSGFDDNLR